MLKGDIITLLPQVFFQGYRDGRYFIAVVPAEGGREVPVPIPLPNADLCDLSPDGSTILFRSLTATRDDEADFYTYTTGAGQLHRLGTLSGIDAAWSPDATRIAYSQGDGIFLARADGSETRKIGTLPGKSYWIRWEPGGAKLRFTLISQKGFGTSLWEIRTDGTGLHPILTSATIHSPQCCGEWTRDGRSFVYQANTAAFIRSGSSANLDDFLKSRAFPPFN